jgi:hypothetical protein
MNLKEDYLNPGRRGREMMMELKKYIINKCHKETHNFVQEKKHKNTA